MDVLEPNTILYEAVTSSVPEDSAKVWSASQAFVKNDIVRSGMYLYTSLQDSNTGHSPPETLSGMDAWWKRNGVTNRGAMFDDHLYSQTIAPKDVTEMTVSVPWERGTSGFALLNVDGTQSIRATVTDDEAHVVFDASYDMIDGADDWWAYYSGAWDYKAEVVVLSSTPLVSGTLTVVLTGGRPAVGHMMVGITWNTGATLYGATAEIKDYSVYNTNDFGELTVIQRNFVKLFNGELYLSPQRADATFRRFINSRAKFCLWMGDNRTTTEDGHEALNVAGYFKSCPLVFSGPNQCQYNIQIEGII